MTSGSQDAREDGSRAAGHGQTLGGVRQPSLTRPPSISAGHVALSSEDRRVECGFAGAVSIPLLCARLQERVFQGRDTGAVQGGLAGSMLGWRSAGTDKARGLRAGVIHVRSIKSFADVCTFEHGAALPAAVARGLGAGNQDQQTQIALAPEAVPRDLTDGAPFTSRNWIASICSTYFYGVEASGKRAPAPADPSSAPGPLYVSGRHGAHETEEQGTTSDG